jgi:3-phenylpropionate/cinnamic acid dioxygenase small subunit
MTVTIEDRVKIDDLLARYCWFVDDGDGDAWAGLWTEDGAFTGIPEPLKGRDQLRQMPGGMQAMFSGRLRHLIGNKLIRAGEHGGEIEVRAYSQVADWREGGKLLSFAKVRFTLVRDGAEFKIKALHADMF